MTDIKVCATEGDIPSLDKDAIVLVGGNEKAENVDYSNVASGLAATNVQAAIDELNEALPDAYTLPTASSAVKGGVRIGTGLEMNGEVLNATGGAVPDIATQAEAEAGTDNTKMMTPQRTKQSITANALPKTDPVANRYRTTSGSYTDFPKAEIIGSAGDTGHTFGGEIGVVGEANADSSTYGVGVGGVGKTNGAQHGIGVFGRAKVNATGDAGNARGGTFLAAESHTGGDNTAVYASAQGGANNYSFYGHSGILYNEGVMRCNTAPVEANDVVRKTELEELSSPIKSVEIYGEW